LELSDTAGLGCRDPGIQVPGTALSQHPAEVADQLINGAQHWAALQDLCEIGLFGLSAGAPAPGSWMSGVGGGYQAGFVGEDDELGAVAGVEFHHGAADVGLGRGR
jgi:hypothetical protein